MENWINELRSQIINTEDLILFNECTGCLQNNYNRASYILAWLMIIESLKRKIHLFSNLGDPKATTAKQRIENAENNNLSTDKMIFEEAKTCGILNQTDSSVMNFLWQQRCLFAHPYNQQPEIDEVKHIITQGLKLVLSKEINYNKDYLTRLSKNITNVPFFLPNDMEIVKEHAENTISRTKKEHHQFFFKTLLYEVGLITNDPEKITELHKLRAYLITLLTKTNIPLTDENWGLEQRIAEHPYTCFLGFINDKTWVKISERLKEMLIDYLQNETNEKKLVMLKSITKNLNEKGLLKTSLLDKYFSKLDSVSFNSAINFYGNSQAQFIRIKSELKSWQYDQQDPVLDFLKNESGINTITKFKKEDNIYLGSLLKYCADNNHYKSQELLNFILTKPNSYSQEFKAGIAYSSFINVREEYKLDINLISNSLNILDNLNLKLQDDIFKKITKTIEKQELTDFDKDTFDNINLTKISQNILNNNKNLKINTVNKFKTIIGKIQKHFA
ncbi:hypothetical protein LNI88_11620 [Tenacibaculum dicentrarchi]|nr:hypothetical protein [Tenacibaculum dicentrarchi]MCD8426014.1 hypothetical protein [Tenacibaculum dicentrarchi]MCD8443242.1 hypothetical protein [Tenacibaculum dicentrarchi]